MKKPLCIYHGGCADGFTAAWAVWKRFGDDFEYMPGIYQNPPPEVIGRIVVLVDFSFKREAMLQLAARADGVLVLDHHKSAMEDLAPDRNYIVDLRTYSGGVDWQRFLDNVAQDGFEGAPHSRIYTLFDLDRSGAGLAWDFFHPAAPRPNLIKYVEDRDLWRFTIPNSREINAAIFSYEYTWANWNDLATVLDGDPMSAVHAGRAIERKHHKDVAELVREMRREIVIGGHWVPAASLPKTLTSDAGHLMCEPYASPNLQGEIVTPPFAACYWDTPDGRVFSLRSVGDFDFSAIAKQYGGGGHKNASGFRVPFDQLAQFEGVR